MTELKACLFDLDGVIVDTAKYHYQAWQQITKALGIPFSLADNEKLKGVSRMDSLDIILKLGKLHICDERKLELAESKNEIYKGFISGMDSSEILPGATKLLSALRRENIKIGLGSSSKNAKTILHQVGLYSQFDTVIDGNMVNRSKPDPEVFLLGAKALQSPPHHCVVFEDAEAGIEAANRAGMVSIGVGSPQCLGKAKMVIPSLDTITPEVIQSLFKVNLEA
ncbi:MAG: beta-phosphoglucomutase [Cyclobacteriaceae bacterium]